VCFIRKLFVGRPNYRVPDKDKEKYSSPGIRRVLHEVFIKTLQNPREKEMEFAEKLNLAP